MNAEYDKKTIQIWKYQKDITLFAIQLIYENYI